MQGSRAYVEAREWPLPTVALNLEILGQDGNYVIWEREGNGLRRIPTTPELNQALAGVVAATTGETPRYIDALMSDRYSFLSAGIPTAVLGTHDRQMAGGGLHRPTDNLARVVKTRLPESVAVLARFLEGYDESQWLRTNPETG